MLSQGLVGGLGSMVEPGGGSDGWGEAWLSQTLEKKGAWLSQSHINEFEKSIKFYLLYMHPF